MLERHVIFMLKEGKAKEFEKFFAKEYAPALRKQTGASHVKLLRELTPPNRYSIVNWCNDHAAAAAWRASAPHNSLSPRLKSLYDSCELLMYEVEDSQDLKGDLET